MKKLLLPLFITAAGVSVATAQLSLADQAMPYCADSRPEQALLP